MTETRNSTLHAARRAKNDEFYTCLEDIENELRHYRSYFAGKTVYLPCDDPATSNFWFYFEQNFDALGLARLVATHYTPGDRSWRREITRHDFGKMHDLTRLDGDGDFRSPECVALLDESDVVVTNPPFSLFSEFVALMVEHNRDFLILGNQNALTYPTIWPLIETGRMWLGTVTNKTLQFAVPDHYTAPDDAPLDRHGRRLVKVPAISWFTTIDHPKQHEDIPLYKTYTPDAYPTYVNYPAIEVAKVAEIPADYEGVMGVPITFLGKHNPDQFEIVGQSRMVAEPMEVNGKRVKDLVYRKGQEYVTPYMRVLIRRRTTA